MTRAWSSIATSSSAGSDACPSNTERWWSCTTTSTCRSTRSPRPSASPSGRSDPVYIMRCAGCARHSMPTPGRPRGRRLDEHRSRHHAHRSVVAGGGRHRAPGPRPGRRARPSPRDLPASTLVAGAEVPRDEQGFEARHRRGGRRGRRPRRDQPACRERSHRRWAGLRRVRIAEPVADADGEPHRCPCR